jgi:hypothetical protein
MESFSYLIIALVFLFFFFIFLPLVILCLILRWIFRIDEIVYLLQQIALKCGVPLENIGKIYLEKCAMCKRKYPINRLIKIDSGHLVCLECRKLHDRFEKQ